jgi:hypothetical protein
MYHLKYSNEKLPSAVFADNQLYSKLFYLISIPNHFSLTNTLLFALCIPFFKKKEWRIFVLYVALPLIIFSLCFENKWARYLFPAYPIICILISSIIKKLNDIINYKPIYMIIIAGLLVEYCSLSFIPLPVLKHLNILNKNTFIERGYAHISYKTNYIEELNSFVNLIKKDFYGEDTIKIGLIESDLFWRCDGYPLIDYILRSSIKNFQIIGDKRDPEYFCSNYRDFDYFIIIEQKSGSRRNIDNIFKLADPKRWVNLGDVNFRKKNNRENIIEFINNRELLVNGFFCPENLEVFLMKK